ncbi:MAG TPA: flagellar biosynthesis protein FlhF [Bacillota bacterium]|nr:flagellar biosynthesis protein FlhF [Bacillota bacterium]
MKIKKITAATMPEAMKQIRTQLGKDAVILQSKEVKSSGFFGLFKKPRVEVIAALDPQPVKRKQKATIKTKNVTPSEFLKQSQLDDFKQQNIVSEIKHLRKMLEQQNIVGNEQFSKSYQLLYEFLIDQEVDQKIAHEIISHVQQKHEGDLTVSIEQLIDDIKKWIENHLAHLSFSGIDASTRIVQLIGPTGVGKTTTLAKLAAKSLLEKKKSVAFITMDTYRIAAIEQLKTYARILEVPIEVAYSLEDYKRAVEKLSSVDLIFVDTAGRNFRESNYVNELTPYIEATKFTEVFFVAALTAKYTDILYTLEQFSHIKNKKVIFTKADETRQYGSLLNIGMQNNVDIAYVTNGQDVPNDIITPTATRISHYIMSEYYD